MTMAGGIRVGGTAPARVHASAGGRVTWAAARGQGRERSHARARAGRLARCERRQVRLNVRGSQPAQVPSHLAVPSHSAVLMPGVLNHRAAPARDVRRSWWRRAEGSTKREFKLQTYFPLSKRSAHVCLLLVVGLMAVGSGACARTHELLSAAYTPSLCVYCRKP